MTWIQKGDLFEAGGKTWLAMDNSYTRQIVSPEDIEAFDAGYDMCEVNDFVQAHLIEGIGNIDVCMNLQRMGSVRILAHTKVV